MTEMWRVLAVVVLFLSVFVVSACGNPLVTPSDTASLHVTTKDVTTKAPVAGATVLAHGTSCTTDAVGSCSVASLPLTTISVTVTHPNYVEVKRDVTIDTPFGALLFLDLQAK
jgi:hypothetical protein